MRHLQIDERMAVSERAVQALKGQVEVLSLDVARLSQGLAGAQALLQGHSGGLEVYMLTHCLFRAFRAFLHCKVQHI
jgi:hypothetical protein